MLRFLKLLRDESGATAIEYALIAALISLACIIAFQSLGLNLADVFNTVADALMRREPQLWPDLVQLVSRHRNYALLVERRTGNSGGWFN